MIKVLAYGEVGKPTGFARVAKGVLTYLHNTGQFDIVMMGLQYDLDTPNDLPFPVFPATNNSVGDTFGVETLKRAIERHKPDVLWTVNDLWNLGWYVAKKPHDLPFVAYWPVDGPNLKWQYSMAVGGITEAAVYTQFGAMESAAGVRDCVDKFMRVVSDDPEVGPDKQLQWMAGPHPGGQLICRYDRFKKFQNVEGYEVIPHGLDKSLFEIRNKSEARKRFGLSDDQFVVLNVNTNQWRKRHDLTMRAFKMLLEQVPNAVLVLHAQGTNIMGQDLKQLAQYIGIGDNVLMVHDHKKALTDDEMVDLYNCADVQINTSAGEGWGLPAFEGAACGVPQLVPDWSSTRELWKGYGQLLPVSDYRFEVKNLNTGHGVVDARATGNILIELAKSDERRQDLRDAGLKLVDRQWSWDHVGAAFERLIRRAVKEPAVQPTSFRDLLESRTGVVKSELAGIAHL